MVLVYSTTHMPNFLNKRGLYPAIQGFWWERDNPADWSSKSHDEIIMPDQVALRRVHPDVAGCRAEIEFTVTNETKSLSKTYLLRLAKPASLSPPVLPTTCHIITRICSIDPFLFPIKSRRWKSHCKDNSEAHFQNFSKSYPTIR